MGTGKEEMEEKSEKVNKNVSRKSGRI